MKQLLTLRVMSSEKIREANAYLTIMPSEKIREQLLNLRVMSSEKISGVTAYLKSDVIRENK